MRTWRELLYIRATYHTPDSELPDMGNIVWTHMQTGEQIEIVVTPLWCGANETVFPETLLEYISDYDWKPLIEGEAAALTAILKALGEGPNTGSIGVVTVWSATAGRSYVPGEPDEYEADVQLVGYLDPITFTVVKVLEARDE
jgi:hypothetical protein